MVKVKVLVTGAAGQVGRELVKLAPAGFEVLGCSSSQLDITDAAQIQQYMTDFQPELIINAAAYTAVDRAESEPEKAYAINEQGVTLLAQAAEAAQIPLLHISTDYVFNGSGTHPYRETDPTAPSSVYGLSKLAGEQALAQFCTRYIILRTSWVFGTEGNNFVKTMLRLGAEREQLSVVADQQGCPTSAGSIAAALWALSERYVAQHDLPWGIYHFSNSPATTWYDFASEIFRQAKAQGVLETIPQLSAIGTEDYPTPAKRPAWSVLDCSKFEAFMSEPALSWQSELSAVIGTLK